MSDVDGRSGLRFPRLPSGAARLFPALTANGMTPLQREVVRRYLTTFVVATIVLTLAIIAFDAAKRLLDEGLSPFETASMLQFLLPGVVRTAMQGATLLAVCLVYGRMAAKNELLALSASGLSLVGIIWPVLLLSVPMSLSCVWLEDVSSTWGENGFRRKVCEFAVDVAYRKLQAEKSFKASDYQLTVTDVRGRVLIRPSLTRSSSDPKQCLEIHAEFGRIEIDRETGNLVVDLQYGTCQTGDVVGRLSFTDRFRHTIPLTWKQNHATSLERIADQERLVAQLAANLEARNRIEVEPKLIPLPPIEDERDGVRAIAAWPREDRIQATSEQVDWRSLDDTTRILPAAASQAASDLPESAGLLADRSDAADRLAADKAEELLREERGELFWRHSLWHQKWANSFCCLTFTLVGIPMAVFLRRSDPLSSFIACFLPILAIYQPLQYFGMAYCARGLMSPLWLHGNNVFLTVFGCAAMYRVLRRY